MIEETQSSAPQNKATGGNKTQPTPTPPPMEEKVVEVEKTPKEIKVSSDVNALKDKPVGQVKPIRRLLLASSGWFVGEKTEDIFPKPLRKMKLAWITTPSKGVSDKTYLEKHKAKMDELKFNYEEVDIEGMNENELRKKLTGFEAIHVEGGNAFYLLKTARESGFIKIVKELINKGIIYIGTSAGSYLACPTIEAATWKEKEKFSRYGVTDFTALNLVPFLIKAHYTPELDEILRKEIANAKYPVKLLTDEQAILVEDENVKFLGGEESVLKGSLDASFSADLPAQAGAVKDKKVPTKKAPAQPKVVGIPEASAIIQPVMNFLDKLKELRARANKIRGEKVEDNLKKVMAYARKTQRVTNDNVERLTGVSDAQAYRYLKKLVEKGKIIKFGKDKATFYKPIKK